VNRVVRSQVLFLKNKNVKVFSDNQNVKSILLNGNVHIELQKISLGFNDFCEENNIHISPEWIPRDNNQISDYLSRCLVCDDWSISDR
jgi:hypothetical protein